MTDNNSGETKNKLLTEIYEWFESIISYSVYMILVLVFLFRISTVHGPSMQHTLHDKDRLFISQLFYTPKYGDIVAIAQPDNGQKPLIKRIIATGGQIIDIDFDNGIVYINEKVLDEPYLGGLTYVSDGMSFPLYVPYGYVFVMGDNRSNSLDSRYAQIGLIDERYIMGRALFRILPLDQFGKLM